MKESLWGIFIVGVGIFMIFFIYFFQSLTTTDEHNYALLKETVEAAMYDSVDLAAYKVEIMDISETPPKVSVRLSSSETTNLTGEILTFDISNSIDAIFEAPY